MFIVADLASLRDQITLKHVNELSEHEHFKVRKTAKIRNQYNQVPHLTQDTT